MTRIDKRESEIEDLHELEIGVPEFEDVDLEDVRKVDEHVVTGFFLAAGNVEADGDDVHVLPPRCEAVLEREGIQPRSRGLYNLGEAQDSGDVPDFSVS